MKKTSQYICQKCGAVCLKWSGKCDECLEWNCLIEENISQKKLIASKPNFFITLDKIEKDYFHKSNRLLTEIDEFDRVCGGGLVPGSVILVGGSPGIGKSTLLLQIVAALSQKYNCAYVSGEEALSQLKLRAERCLVNKSQVYMAASTQVDSIIAALNSIKELAFVVIDSIQTMILENLSSASGTVSQVRACAQELISAAKAKGYIVIMVGHVTKEGVIAGPRVLEHMVDTVLYFEGEKNYDYRILRSIKNRFGATDEIGVFSMGDKGLKEVTNPSELFLAHHQHEISGTAIFAGIEGTRPVLLEVQALVSPSYLPSPRRTAIGWDNNRLAMVLAVLESRCGLKFANKDIYLNIVGGLKITEPAADLAVAMALVSAVKDIPLPKGGYYFGEIGLGGEVRPVNFYNLRIKEAEKLGLLQAFCAYPKDHKRSVKSSNVQSNSLKSNRECSKAYKINTEESIKKFNCMHVDNLNDLLKII